MYIGLFKYDVTATLLIFIALSNQDIPLLILCNSSLGNFAQRPIRHVINDFLFHFFIKINSYEKAALRARLISMTSSNSVVLSLKSFSLTSLFTSMIKIHSFSYLFLIIYSPALSQVSLCRDLESSFILFHRPDYPY